MHHRSLNTGVAVLAAAALSVLASGPAAASSPAGETDTKTTSAGPVSPEYRVGPGDKLRIEVYKDAQMSQSVQVRPDGKITLPLVGDIEAAGATPLELRDTIVGQLKDYISSPVVTVIVVEATAAMAYVVGEVNHPGAVTLQSGPLTVLQAIALAGGVKDFADTKNIRILRQSAILGTQSVTFNYKEAIHGVGAAVYLRPGDTVVVPD